MSGSPRLAIKAWIKQVTEDTNELFLGGESVPATRESQAKPSVNIFSDNIRLIVGFGRYYRETRSGYLKQERGIRRDLVLSRQCTHLYPCYLLKQDKEEDEEEEEEEYGEAEEVEDKEEEEEDEEDDTDTTE